MNEMSLKDRLAQYDKAVLVEFIATTFSSFIRDDHWRWLDRLAAWTRYQAATERARAATAKHNAAFDAYMGAPRSGRKKAMASLEFEKAKAAERRALKAEENAWNAYQAADDAIQLLTGKATDAAE